MFKNCICFLFFIFFWFFAEAQDYRYKFRHFNVAKGLAHTDVTSVVQDDEGFIWIGTYGGLDKFDGYNFQLFTNTNESLSTAYVNRILDMGRTGKKLLLATQGGLRCFNTIKEKFVPIHWKGTKNSNVGNLKADAVLVVNDRVFLACPDALYVFKLDSFGETVSLTEIDVKGVSSRLSVKNMISDHKGNVWATARGNLYLFVQNELGSSVHVRKITVADENKKKVSGFVEIFLDDKKQLWLGGLNSLFKGDIYSVTDDYISVHGFKDFYQNLHDGLRLKRDVDFYVTSINETKDSNLWLGTDHGLVKFSENDDQLDYVFYSVEARDDLMGQRINNLITDAKGNLWVTTYSGGVYFTDINQKNFHLIVKSQEKEGNTLVSNFVRALAEDREGNLWIGTERDGLMHYDFRTEKFTAYQHNKYDPNSIISNNIRALAYDSLENLWVATVKGISILDFKEHRTTHLSQNDDDPNSLSHSTIFSLAEDKFGNMWAGSFASGLNRITRSAEGYKVRRFFKDANSPFGLTSDAITYIQADKKRPQLFVATGDGLNQIFLDFEGNVREVKQFVGVKGYPGTLNSNFIWPIERANDSILWVGTIGGGLNKLTLTDESPYGYWAEIYPLNKKFPYSDVESLLLDTDENLWVGGKWLSRLDTTTDKVINFTVEDGLQGNSFKIGGSLRGNSGRYYFSGTQGITYFYPEEIKADTTKSNIVLTSLMVNNRMVEIDSGDRKMDEILDGQINEARKIVLNYKQNDITLRFSSLDFFNAKGAKFRYKMEGLDTGWIEIDGTYPQVSYANLDYGGYVFKVMAANKDGEWSDKVKELSVTITPPWWLAPPAKFIYTLILFGMLYGAYRWLLLKRAYDISELERKQKEQINLLRLEFFTNVSHEFRTPLTMIINPLEELAKGNIGERKRLRYYSHMLNNTKRMLQLINELMDFQKIETKVYELNLQKEDIEVVIKEVQESFREFAYSKDIDFSYGPKVIIDPFWFDRTVIERILYNLLGNAFKFTGRGGQITIELYKGIYTGARAHQNSYKIGTQVPGQDYVGVKVTDTGKGIAEREIGFIFGRFFHKADSVVNENESSGVGLSLVKSLVTLHNGSIMVSSEEGKGTSFYVSLPYILNHKKENILGNHVELSHLSLSPVYYKPNIGASHSQAYGKPAILIVEDNRELRHFVRENFENEFHVLEAGNGEEALSVLQNHLPDLIISDIMMPKMDGIELCKKVKTDSELQNIPFILLTSNLSIEKQLEGANARADLYLSKPFSIDVLKISIQNIISNRRKIRSAISNNNFREIQKLSGDYKDEELIQTIIHVIREHIEDDGFDVAKLSDIINMSRTKVYNSIKRITGKSSGELIREIRVKRAAQLLASEDISVAQAMYKVGIQSSSYFTKVFKKEYGKTPSQFVKDTTQKN